MARCIGFLFSAIVVGLFVLAFSSEASAYIDSATAQLIIQFVIASIATVLVGMGIFWRRVLGLFGWKDKSANADADVDTDVEAETEE